MTATAPLTSPLTLRAGIHFSQFVAMPAEDWAQIAAALRQIAASARASMSAGTFNDVAVQHAAALTDQLDHIADQLDLDR